MARFCFHKIVFKKCITVPRNYDKVTPNINIFYYPRSDSLSSGSHGLKEVSDTVHNESSSLLSLALTSTSSLGCVIRYFYQCFQINNLGCFYRYFCWVFEKKINHICCKYPVYISCTLHLVTCRELRNI